MGGLPEEASDRTHHLLLPDTSLAQSLTAAIQCFLNGRQVIQIDPASYYGGPGAGSHKVYVNSQSTSDSSSPSTRHFIFDPSPVIFYARGPLARLLIDLQLTEYLEFAALQRSYLWASETLLISLPLSKEDVMLEPALTLLEKRKLMRILKDLSEVSEKATETPDQQTLGGYLLHEAKLSIDSRVFQMVVFGAVGCESIDAAAEMPLRKALQTLECLRLSCGHLERPSPFVIPVWGSSELVQAACRKAAVFGAIQIVGPEAIKEAGDFISRVVKGDVPVTGDQTRAVNISRGCWLLGQRGFLGVNEAARFVIPPNSLSLNPSQRFSVEFVQFSSDGRCCPDGTWLLYGWTCSDDVRDPFKWMAAKLIRDGNDVLWQKQWQVTEVPEYSAEFQATVAHQPILPANYAAEWEFVQQLQSFQTRL